MARHAAPASIGNDGNVVAKLFNTAEFGQVEEHSTANSKSKSPKKHVPIMTNKNNDITQSPQFKAFKAAIDKMVDDFWKHEAERIDKVMTEYEYNKIKAQLAILKDVANEYRENRTIGNIIANMEARLKNAEKGKHQ